MTPWREVYHNVVFRTSEPEELPAYYIHRTDDQADAESIAANGFDLRKCGRTARKYNAPEYLHKYDPWGVYALPCQPGSAINYQLRDPRPYVVFRANIECALMLSLHDAQLQRNIKQILSEWVGGVSGLALRRALLDLGFQAVITDDGECVILDLDRITIIKRSEVKNDEK